MSVNFLISQAKNIQIVIDENAAEIEALDQNIGDGDHIFNVQRGLKLVVELENDIKNIPLQKGLNMIAMKVLSGMTWENLELCLELSLCLWLKHQI